MPKHTPIKFVSTLEPSLEKDVAEFISHSKTAKTIAAATLAIVAMGGILTIGVIAPNILGLTEKMIRRKRKNKRDNYNQIWRAFQELKKRHDVKFIAEKNGYLVYGLTETGKSKVRKLVYEHMSVPTPMEWDKKWRLIIFDIPEYRRKDRDAFRDRLNDMGFYQVQKSVWIHPFPCLEEIEFCKDILEIKSFVKIFTLDEMTDGNALYFFRNLIKKIIVG